MAQKGLSVAVTRLLEFGKPRFINGRWRKPVVSRRQMNDIRKYMVKQGEEWPEKKLRDRGSDKPFKLTKLERGRDERQARIEENMRKMPQMIADYRKRIYELREKTRKKRTEEEDYMLATGKKKQEGPYWQIYKDASRRR